MIGQWLPVVLAVAAWPAAVAVMVLAVVTLVPSAQQAAVLAGIAEILRAVRGKTPDASAPVARGRPPEGVPPRASSPSASPPTSQLGQVDDLALTRPARGAGSPWPRPGAG